MPLPEFGKLFRRPLSPKQQELATLRVDYRGRVERLLGVNTRRIFDIKGSPEESDFPNGSGSAWRYWPYLDDPTVEIIRYHNGALSLSVGKEDVLAVHISLQRNKPRISESGRIPASQHTHTQEDPHQEMVGIFRFGIHLTSFIARSYSFPQDTED